MKDGTQKSIIITGATGFLGSHILEYLVNHTSDNLIILKRSFSNTRRIKSLLENPRVSTFDIDKSEIKNIDWKDVDTIIHCATEYGRQTNSCYKVLETNLMFPIKLVECAIENNVKTFINTDSYFNKENMAYSHLLNYSLSKKSINLWLRYFSKKIKVINMVLEHIYGENDNPDKFVEQMIQKIAINPVESIDLTSGEQKRDFIYAEDVCKAYLAAVKYSRENNFRYRQFDIGTGNPVSIKAFILAIKEAAGDKEKPVLNFGAFPYREDEIMCSYADTVELSNLIDVEDLYFYKDGIKRIVNYYKGDISASKR